MWLVATEDELSEAVARKLLRETGASVGDAAFVRRNGFGYLKSKVSDFCNVRGRPILVIADLDATVCASRLIEDWFGRRARPQNLVFRVAVREVEAWLLADREGIAAFMKISPANVERNPETLVDPKRYLLGLAKKAPREIRNDLLPSRGSVALQGFGYNLRLGEFVANRWSAQKAADASQSLQRARERIRECTDRFTTA